MAGEQCQDGLNKDQAEGHLYSVDSDRASKALPVSMQVAEGHRVVAKRVEAARQAQRALLTAALQADHCMPASYAPHWPAAFREGHCCPQSRR